MTRGDGPEALRLAMAVADGSGVGWAEEVRRHPALEPRIAELRVVERVTRAFAAVESDAAHAAENLLREGLAGRYALGKAIGVGGMATVFGADDLKHGRRVAIKLLHPHVAAAIGRDHFRREIEIVARLTHPHIVPLYDSGEVAGHLYYVMPFISGESLRARLRRQGMLPVAEALELAREIASALGNAHHHGLVHRDVKPENVLLSDGIALVADFGIARVTSAGLVDATTGLGTIAGTPAYMAPEQILGKAVDARTDVYALGCVLYEMLAGHPPFTGPAASLPGLHLTAEPEALEALRPDVPPAIAAWVARALAKDPAQRPGGMAELAQALAAGGDGGAMGAPPPDPETLHHLPRPRTRFIGRDSDLGRAERALRATRLLTITGMGGTGKTWLAVQLTRRAGSAFPAGAWFVDLAPLVDVDRVASAVAVALGVREEAGAPLPGAIARRLGADRHLLILDNCEHVRAGARDLAEALLDASPGITVLATSRESLGLAGEQTIALGPLAVPEPAAKLTAVETSEAVRLFVDRARLTDPDFALTPGNAGAIAEICRQVDGIPLAIELAAARVRLLGAGELLRKLEDRFRLLRGGHHADPRHRTLTAMLDSSHDLLAEDERAAFRALGAFRGGWALEAATAVAGADADEFETLDVLGRLADKSLVTIERAEGDVVRYGMLETVRVYAAEKLAAAPEADAVRTRHLDYFVALGARLETDLPGEAMGDWLARLDREQGNLLLALEACDQDPGGGNKGLRLAAGMLRYWVSRGLLALGYRHCRAALERPGAEAPSSARVGALISASYLASLLGRLDECRAWSQEAGALSRVLGDPRGTMIAVGHQAHFEAEAGDFDAARRLREEGLELARELGSPWGVALAMNNLGDVLRANGAPDDAKRIYEEAFPLHREAGNLDGTALTHTNLARAEVELGDLDAARRNLAESLRIAAEIGSRHLGTWALEVVAGLAVSAGDPAWALRCWGAEEAQRIRMGIGRERLDDMFIAPLVERGKAALTPAAAAEAIAAGEALDYETAIEAARAWLEALPA